jgi:hypothetical protein
MNVGSNYVTNFSKNTHIALADIGQRRLKRKAKTKEGNQGELSTIVLPSVASLYLTMRARAETRSNGIVTDWYD